MQTYLETLKAQHAAAIKDLATMPDSRIGSEWQLDRVADALWLADEIARVEKSSK
jgi:hypothetical protein